MLDLIQMGLRRLGCVAGFHGPRTFDGEPAHFCVWCSKAFGPTIPWMVRLSDGAVIEVMAVSDLHARRLVTAGAYGAPGSLVHPKNVLSVLPKKHYEPTETTEEIS